MTSSGSASGPASSGAVLFDIDGTLLDSTYHHALAWHRAFTRCDIAVPLWKVHRAIGMGGDRLVAHVAGDDVEKEHGDELRDGWEQEYAEVVAEVRPLPGASELIRKLAGEGYVVALASSGKKGFSEDAVKTLDVGDEVHTLTTADDAEESKPEPDILSSTLNRLDVERAAFVGDTPYDVEAADRLGLRTVAVLTGGFSRAELEDAGAAMVVEALTEVLDLDWDELLSPLGGDDH
jgi:HAD superfamily hydrolase (TIGR01549 family)